MQYLTFRLGDEEYGIEVLRVQEIKAVGAITPMPNTPRHVKGVMNLRGAIVPIVDLRARLGMAEAPYGRFTVIIVVTVGAKAVGLVVDAVCDVLTVRSGDVEPAPGFASGPDGAFIDGLAHSGERLVVLLNLDAILWAGDAARVAAG